MANQRKATVRLKLGKRGFHFFLDGSVNDKRNVFYTTKRAAQKGIKRFMVGKLYRVVDETGVTHRGNKMKK